MLMSTICIFLLLAITWVYEGHSWHPKSLKFSYRFCGWQSKLIYEVAFPPTSLIWASKARHSNRRLFFIANIQQIHAQRWFWTLWDIHWDFIVLPESWKHCPQGFVIGNEYSHKCCIGVDRKCKRQNLKETKNKFDLQILDNSLVKMFLLLEGSMLSGTNVMLITEIFSSYLLTSLQTFSQTVFVRHSR